MKMRVRGNSLRLRLTKSEVSRFAVNGAVEEIIDFGAGQTLIYALESKAGIETTKAEFANNRIVVFVPSEQVRAWADSNEIGIESIQKIDAAKTLRLLIEKDFACLDRRESEEDSDAFPHPLAGKTC